VAVHGFWLHAGAPTCTFHLMAGCVGVCIKGLPEQSFHRVTTAWPPHNQSTTAPQRRLQTLGSEGPAARRDRKGARAGFVQAPDPVLPLLMQLETSRQRGGKVLCNQHFLNQGGAELKVNAVTLAAASCMQGLYHCRQLRQRFRSCRAAAQQHAGTDST